MDISLDSICQIDNNCSLIVLLALIALTLTTNDLFIYLFNVSLQPFVFSISIIREMLRLEEPMACDYLYSPADLPVYKFPAIDHVYLGSFLGLIIFYNLIYSYYKHGWLSKLFGCLLLIAIEVTLLVLHVASPLYGLVSFMIGVAYSAFYVMTISWILERYNKANFDYLMRSLFCRDILLQIHSKSISEQEKSKLKEADKPVQVQPGILVTLDRLEDSAVLKL